MNKKNKSMPIKKMPKYSKEMKKNMPTPMKK